MYIVGFFYTSLGGINIRMLLVFFCNPSEYIYIL